MSDEGEVVISTVSLPDDNRDNDSTGYWDAGGDFWKKTAGAPSSAFCGVIHNRDHPKAWMHSMPQPDCRSEFLKEIATLPDKLSKDNPEWDMGKMIERRMANLGTRMIRMSSATIKQPPINQGDEVDDDLFDTDDDEENMSATDLPSLDFIVQGQPLNQAILNPSQIDGIIISEVGRNEDGSMYVVATDAITGTVARLEAAERLKAERDNARKLFDVANRLNQERATQISELKARLAALTTEQTEVEWSQPAEVGAMGQPRAGRGFRW